MSELILNDGVVHKISVTENGDEYVTLRQKETGNEDDYVIISRENIAILAKHFS